ncbi:type II pantothenate kinase [Bacillus sp. UNC322MFChir4.1]|uniref:type II pantothenate kinase n=1 Tax=Bacillus sp. UNC322MFChir4.1 TaxID=1449045 RepID=UPI0005512CD7|nr:type II pantothenate kinase [Bacillus sp. UNC322MFChir4.1]
MQGTVGIDVGGTLTKIAYFDKDNELQLHQFSSNELEKVARWMNTNDFKNEICITGGKAEQLKKLILGKQYIHYILEFDATCRGVNYLLHKSNYSLENYVVANIGTGTSIHIMFGNTYNRIGGTGIGGGTLKGLSTLLTGIENFDEIVKYSKTGSRTNLDIKVSDIYNEIKSPIDGDLTASNFGNAAISKGVNNKSDLIATVQGLVGEVITTLSLQIAEAQSIDNIVYIGSTLSSNEPLKDIISGYTLQNNKNPIFFKDPGFSGAIGALLSKTSS